ncbi:hypothetical protein EV714DRAFT_241621 [Schizophyllum commune]
MSRVFLVTGSNTGIGYEIVKQVASKDKSYIVYLTARSEDKAKEALASLQKEGVTNVKSVVLDITDVKTIAFAKETIEKAEGKLDVLVNNAGNGFWDRDQDPRTANISAVRDAIELNLIGLIQATTAFLPLLRKGTNPVILNVSTDMASQDYLAKLPSCPLHIAVAYNTSKAAANSYTISLSKVLEAEGIKVNAATPGYTATKLNNFGTLHEGAKSVQEGAAILVPWALLDKDGPTGKFIWGDGTEHAW